MLSPEVPGELWTHFTFVEMPGYRQLAVGQEVEFDWEHVPGGQDGYVYRARLVAPVA